MVIDKQQLFYITLLLIPKSDNNNILIYIYIYI